MGAWTRELLQAEWWPRGGQGSAPLSTIAAASLIGCIINSAGKDFMRCIVCQNTCKQAEAGKVPYIVYFITFCLWTRKGTQWIRLTGPVRRASLQLWPASSRNKVWGELQKYSNHEVAYQGLEFCVFSTKIQELIFLQKEKKFGHTICVQEIKLDDHSDHFWPHNILISKILSFSLFFAWSPMKELRTPTLHLLDFTIHLSLLILLKSWKSNIFSVPTSGNNQNFVQHYGFYSNTHK